MRDATAVDSVLALRLNDFNPRIPCGMRLATLLVFQRLFCDFNPRIPCGMRLIFGGKTDLNDIFQSTHPMRDATLHDQATAKMEAMHFNPRIPCGMRLKLTEGTDYVNPFQSTHPMRDATKFALMSD